MEVHSDGPNSETIGGNGDFAEERLRRDTSPGEFPAGGSASERYYPSRCT
jgi:hypothetical protein